MFKINELPNEMICMIFNHLDQIDTLNNCRLVCKKWKSIIDSIPFQKLIVTNYQNDDYDYRLVQFSSTYLNNFMNVGPLFPTYSNITNHLPIKLSSTDLNNFVYFGLRFNYEKVFKTKFQNLIYLKYFKIDFRDPRVSSLGEHIDFKSFDIKLLNQFIYLERLEITGAIQFQSIDYSETQNKLIDSKKKSITLYLPNLKYIHLFTNTEYYFSELTYRKLIPKNSNIYNHLNKLNTLNSLDNFDLSIDAPKLEVLICFNLSKIKLIHPESIKILLERFVCQASENLNSFNNLEVYRMESYSNNVHYFHSDDFSESEILNFTTLLLRDQDLLSKLPISLKKIYFNFNFLGKFELLKTLDTILKDKLVEKISKIRIYLNDIELIENKPIKYYGFEYYGYEPEEELKLYHKNYDQITNAPSLTKIYYKDLLEIFNNIIPIDFCTKFNNIHEITVMGFVNQDQLIWFLNGCSNLTSLSLYCEGLNQQFHNQLPKICSSLVELYLFRPNQNIQIGCKFIFQFKILSNFETNLKYQVHLGKYLAETIFLINFKFADLAAFKNPRTNLFKIYRCFSPIHSLSLSSSLPRMVYLTDVMIYKIKNRVEVDKNRLYFEC